MAVTQPGIDVGAALSRATSRPAPTPVPAAPDTAGTSDQGADQGADQLLKAAQAAMAKFQEGAPKSEPTSPEQTWGSMAMAVAALGGLLTHAPITTAANAMAGVLNATRQGDQARAQKEFEQWQVSHEAAGKMVDYTLKLYDDALKLHSPQARLATIRALDAQFKLDEDRAFLQQAGGDPIAAARMRVQALRRVRASSRTAGEQITATHESATQAQNDQQAIAEGLGSEDPNKQADALDRYANAIDKSQGGKGSTANTRLEGLTVGVRLRAMATELRSGDPTRVAAARTDVASIQQGGPAVLKAPRTPTPGSVDPSRSMTSWTAHQMQDFVTHHPDATAEEIGAHRAILEGRSALNANQFNNLEYRVQSFTVALDAVQKIRDLIPKAFAIATRLGKPLEKAEAIGNMLGVDSDTDRADFQSALAMLKNNAQVLLKQANPTSRAIGSDQALVDTIIRGENWGDSALNVESAMENLNSIFQQDLAIMRNQARRSGQDLSLPNRSAPAPSAAPAPGAAPAEERPWELDRMAR